jgi:hypothetical protein
MEYEYSISDNLEVYIFVKNDKAPIYYQPTWPNGTNWASQEEAETWAALMIESILDKNEPHPPYGPGEDRLPQINEEESE